MRTITYFEKSVNFPDRPVKERFFTRLQAGLWEPDTFRTIARLVDRNTTFIDIGAWIGVTPFWAAQGAHSVIAVEPDPVCFDVLTSMKRVNAGDVRLLNAALSQEAALTLHSVGGGFGSSETSALIADAAGDAITVPTVTIADLQAMAPTRALCFKIDIEGYEYRALAQFRAIDRNRTRGLMIAVHPQILAATLTGAAPLRIARTMTATFGLIASFKGFRLDNPSVLWRALLKSVARGKLQGFDLVFVSRSFV